MLVILSRWASVKKFSLGVVYT